MTAAAKLLETRRLLDRVRDRTTVEILTALRDADLLDLRDRIAESSADRAVLPEPDFVLDRIHAELALDAAVLEPERFEPWLQPTIAKWFAESLRAPDRSFAPNLAMMIGLADRSVPMWLEHFHRLEENSRRVVLALFRRTGSRHRWLPPVEALDPKLHADEVARAVELLRELQKRTLAD